jgi:hypothetical protein
MQLKITNNLFQRLDAGHEIDLRVCSKALDAGPEIKSIN